MFIVEWLAALIKISFQIVFAIITAIPFYYSWNCVAETYFTFLPEIWFSIPYWHVVALLLSVTYVGSMINKLTPKIVSISQSVDQSEK